MKKSRIIFVAVAALAVPWQASAFDHPSPGVGPGANGARYATDAYPGFDSEDSQIKPERKEPKWFAFINGPDCSNAKDQFEYCTNLAEEGNYSKARKQFDALVREWPTAPEAPKAQLAIADICFSQLNDYEDAFAEYRYLLDFYSLQCDFAKIADKLYETAGILKLEGKEVMFIRFANTVDVRRAYESCVLRAPGAKWVTEAMLIIGQLREDEGKYGQAVKVYENLRNLYPDSVDAKLAIGREAAVRMLILRDHEYNRHRCQDTINFMQLALRTCNKEDMSAIQDYLNEAKELIEREDFLGAKFYDSTTRTKRSAISAYEKFLADYPQGDRSDWVRERLVDLKGESK